MSKKVSSLNIGLLDNGSHSLKRGYEIWKEWETTKDPWLLKESIIWAHHGIELLLKQLLVQSNELLIFQNEKKAAERFESLKKRRGMENATILSLFDYDDGVMSVGFKDVVKRTNIILNVAELSEKAPLRILIDDLTRYRNKIVHFSVDLDVIKVSTLLFDILDPLLTLLSKKVLNDTFRKVTIPEIIKSAKPIYSYVERNRDKIARHAFFVTHDALTNCPIEKIGVVTQATGTGITRSLVEYLSLIRTHPVLCLTPILILVDLNPIKQQLLDSLPERFSVTIDTKKNFISKGIEYKNKLLVIGFQTRLRPHEIDHLLPNSAKILFTSSCTAEDEEFFGSIISEFQYTAELTNLISKYSIINWSELDVVR
ncbi:hypothetical protein [Vibrio rhodolitus]|uniref:hypothetical protein n=1 Tax=Vibrio rhodolitus TaxID=2231649 RepID=UPI000E09F1BF|nr:hypothetical protein [Vibrio rhodolitus]